MSASAARAAAGSVPEGISEAEYLQAWTRRHGYQPDADGNYVRTPRWALRGAALVAAAAILVGVVGGFGYLLAALIVTGLGVALIGWKFRWLDARAPARIPRGRVLGATAMLPVILVLLVPFLALRQHNIERSQEIVANTTLEQANTAMDEGDLRLATSLLKQAEQISPGIKGRDALLARLAGERRQDRIAQLEAELRALQARRAR